MKRHELGQMAGKIVSLLHRENPGEVKKYGQLNQFVSGEVLGGKFPLSNVIQVMRFNSKTPASQELIGEFEKGVVAQNIGDLSFYQIAAKVPDKESLWVGEDFEAGYLDAIMEISHG